MRYKFTDPRYDDPQEVDKHIGKYLDGKALIILGGYSSENWAELYAKLCPDVVIGGNGVNSLCSDLDYWLMCENLAYSNGLAQQGDRNKTAIMEMFYRPMSEKTTRFVSHRSWSLLRDKKNCVKIRRQGWELEEIKKYFSFRDYGMGLLEGWLLKDTAAGAAVYVGTVGAQALHLAGILGCAEVHTIGYDLMFRDHLKHHAYPYPAYGVDKFRNASMFINHEGIPTQRVWLESAQWLKEIEPLFKRDGLRWTDHSDGLLKILRLDCAK